MLTAQRPCPILGTADAWRTGPPHLVAGSANGAAVHETIRGGGGRFLEGVGAVIAIRACGELAVDAWALEEREWVGRDLRRAVLLADAGRTGPVHIVAGIANGAAVHETIRGDGGRFLEGAGAVLAITFCGVLAVDA